MSIHVSGREAQVHWLSNASSTGFLTQNQAVLYVPEHPNKLGQVTRDSAAGLTPAQVFETRYLTADKSGIANDIIAQDLFVIDKIRGANYDYDDAVRKLINKLHKRGFIPFRANVNHTQEANTNSEALIGYKRKKHLPLLVQVIKQYLGIETYWDTRDPVVFRYGQSDVVSSVVEILKRDGLCLAAAYTSFGKTLISTAVARDLLPGGGIVLVTTPITDTKSGFQSNIEDLHFGTDRSKKIVYMDSKDFARKNVREIQKRARAGELIVIVLTVQDLRYDDGGLVNGQIQNLRKKYQSLSGKIDLWIRDERHTQYGGPITQQRLSNLQARYYLDLTATPYNVLNLYTAESVVTRTLLWGLLNRKHTGLPEIAISGINTPISKISNNLSNLFTIEEGFDGRKLVVQENNQFVFSAELQKISDLFYISTLSKRKNPLSIVNDTELSEVAKRCGLWVLPEGQNGAGAAEYIPQLADLLNRDPELFYTDSYTVSKLATQQNIKVSEVVEDLLSRHNRVIILTCGKFLTGTDIPALGHIVLFDRINSIMTFEQVMGRMIRKYPGKDRVKLYTLAPAMETRLLLSRLAQANTDLDPTTTEYEFLDCVPLTEYSDMDPVRITPQEILGDMAVWMAEKLRARIPQYSLTQAIIGTDISLWKPINMRNLKSVAPNQEFTENNGSKVKIKINNSKGSNKQKQKNKEEIQAGQIAEAIQSVVAESSDIAYVKNCYDYRRILQMPELTQRFNNNECAAVLDTARQSRVVSSMLDTYYAERKSVWQHLPYTQVRPVVFANTVRRESQGMVFTPDGIINEVLNNKMVFDLPKRIDKFTKKPYTIGVYNALDGGFPLAIRKLIPDARIVCIEYFDECVDFLKNNLGLEVVKYKEVDEKYMKQFDTLVGNPPFKELANNGRQTNKSIWKDFLIKSGELLKDGGVVALIHPSGWCSPSDSGKLIDNFFTKYNLLFANISSKIKDYFPRVSSTFSYTITKKEPYQNETILVCDDDIVKVNLQVTKTLAKNGMSIISKITNSNHARCNFKLGGKDYEYPGKGYRHNEQPADAIYLNIHAVNSSKDYLPDTTIPVRYSLTPSPIQNKKKVVIPYNGPVKVIIDNGTMGVGWAQTLILKDTDDLNNVSSVFNSKLFRFFANQKFTQYNENKNLNQFPLLDFSKPWSDERLFNEFGLTKKEQEYIKNLKI